MTRFQYRLRADRGSGSVWIATLGLVFILLLSMIVDNQLLRSGRRQAGDIATEAARAGAQALDRDELGQGVVALDHARATDIVNGYVGNDMTAVVSFPDDDVQVTVSFTVDLHFGLVQGDTQTVSATRRAEITQG